MARLILDPDGRQLRDRFQLRKWFSRDPQTRQRYFGEIEHIMELFRTNDGDDPPDKTIVKMLAIVCENDGAFESHVLNMNQADTPWKELRETGASVALEGYIREKEAGSWP